PVFVITHEADCSERKRRLKGREIAENIVRASTIRPAFTKDIGQHFFGRVPIDIDNRIHYEITSGHQAGAPRGGFGSRRHRTWTVADLWEARAAAKISCVATASDGVAQPKRSPSRPVRSVRNAAHI